MHSALKIFVPGIFLSVLTLAGYRGFPTSCVRLPNGINIGKQALIDLSASYFKPNIVPKFENGASLLSGDAWPFFVTETTVYGLALEADYRNEPPHLNWSSAMFRKRRTDNDEQTTEAGRDYHEVEAS